MLLVTGLLPLWNRLRASAVAQSLLAGANAMVVGILLAALYQPIWASAIDSGKSLALALILFAGLQVWKIAPWILVVIGAVLGGIFFVTTRASSNRSKPKYPDMDNPFSTW
jgi:chromate transporter